jgi:SNF2 family DNA or RNA helicase
MNTTVELDDGLISIYAPMALRELVKQVPGARYDSKNQRWTAPLSWGVCLALRGVFGPDLEVGPQLVAWASNHVATVVNPALELHAARDAEGDPRLFPYQRATVAFTKHSGSILNASEMGLGKTVETIMAVNKWPVLVVCNNTMKDTWRKEFHKWAPHAEVVVLRGGSVKIRKLAQEPADVYIINWESLRLHTRLAPYGSIRLKRCEEHGGFDKETACEVHERVLNHPWGTVVADEAHRAKDPQAKQTRALWAVGSHAEQRIALTGTPVANAPDDLWSIVHFVSPDDWPAKTRFLERYCMMGVGQWGGVDIIGLRHDTRDEFFRILDPMYRRDTKAAVLEQLPPKTYTSRTVDMPVKQARAYKQMREQMLAELDGGVTVVTNPLARAVRLSQFACAYAEVEGDTLRLADPSCKVDALLEIVEELGDAQAVVFAESKQLINLAAARLDKAGVSYGLITGDVPEAERTNTITQFTEGQRQLILATLGAGGESITLTAAATAIFLQRSWSLVKNKQAEDRIHRIGQESPIVEIIDVISAGTIEEYRFEVLEDKEERLQEITRDAELLRAALEWRGA